MIQRTVPTLEIKDWQDELKQLIQSPEELIDRLQLEPKWLKPAKDASAHFPLRLTESYLSRIKKSDPNDPLLLQVLPLEAELESPSEYIEDPLDEKSFQPLPGIIHKYQSRVLFVAATQCAINCRYCFRRHFPYTDNQLSRNQWLDALAYVKATPTINEIILSGGDPLSLSDKQIAWIVDESAKIPHLLRIRIHTRYPIILPSRMTPALLETLTKTRLQAIIVIHCNHPQEIDHDVELALQRIKNAQITLFNQTVLLKRVNDDSQILAELSEKLFLNGVIPYYLHLLDKVKGASHFDVKQNQAIKIYKHLLTLLPGYLIPKLVKELPNERSKTPIAF